jgi:hypothetical protein
MSFGSVRGVPGQLVLAVFVAVLSAIAGSIAVYFFAIRSRPLSGDGVVLEETFLEEAEIQRVPTPEVTRESETAALT